jgi:hypothetical protein
MRALPWLGEVAEQELADALRVARVTVRAWKADLIQGDREEA